MWLLVVCAVLLVGLTLSAAGALLWRSSERKNERLALQATASSVTDTLGTLLPAPKRRYGTRTDT
jgi:hypothetical protein